MTDTAGINDQKPSQLSHFAGADGAALLSAIGMRRS
jgi:hypothetical protein